MEWNMRSGGGDLVDGQGREEEGQDILMSIAGESGLFLDRLFDKGGVHGGECLERAVWE